MVGGDWVTGAEVLGESCNDSVYMGSSIKSVVLGIGVVVVEELGKFSAVLELLLEAMTKGQGQGSNRRLSDTDSFLEITNAKSVITLFGLDARNSRSVLSYYPLNEASFMIH